MTTIQIDDQVFTVLQRAAVLLFEPSPNKVLRRILLSDPILGSLPDGPWPSVTDIILDDAAIEAAAASETNGPAPSTTLPAPPVRIPHPVIPPPRVERAPEPPPRLPAWQSLGDVLTSSRTPSVSARAGSLPPGLRQALDVIHLVVRHRVPRPEAIRRVSDLRRAAGSPTDGPRLTVTATEFDRMIRQHGCKDLRAMLKETFPGHDASIDGFFDELSASRKKTVASA